MLIEELSRRVPRHSRLQNPASSGLPIAYLRRRAPRSCLNMEKPLIHFLNQRLVEWLRTCNHRQYEVSVTV